VRQYRDHLVIGRGPSLTQGPVVIKIDDHYAMFLRRHHHYVIYRIDRDKLFPVDSLDRL
jgi:hypothetical protein